MIARTQFYNIYDMCALLAVSEETIRRWIRQNRIPKPIQIGRVLRWEPSTIDAWRAAGYPPQRTDAQE